MIGFVRGKVHAVGMDYVLLDCNGIGFRIAFNRPEYLHLGEEITIYTYQNVREDEISLFGFLSLEEYDLFIKLISVKGLGPKIASNILSSQSVSRIVTAIENNDVDFMKKMPGIGAKTASQIILDLKGKLVETKTEERHDPKLDDVFEALKSLGYKANEINPVIKKIKEENLSTDEYIKKALGLLLKQR